MEDWFVAAVDEVERAGRAASSALDDVIRELQSARQARRAGRPIGEIVDELIAAGGRESRLSAADAFDHYERAVASMRAAVVRALVDDDGQTFTEVGRRLGVSRSMVARLYRTAAEETS